MNDLVTIASDFVEHFFEQPPRILIVLGLVFFGYGLKKSLIDNRLIPLLLPAIGMIFFPAMLGEGVHTWGGLAVQGFVGGCLAVWINQTYRQVFAAYGKDNPTRSANAKKETNEKEHDHSAPAGPYGSGHGDGV